jgi:hypothetical protein
MSSVAKYISFCDPSDVVDEEGKLLPLKQMPPHVRAAVSSIESGGRGCLDRFSGLVKC